MNGVDVDRVERGLLVDRRDRDDEAPRDQVEAAVGDAAVVHHGDDDGGRAAGEGERGIREHRAGARAGVAERDCPGPVLGIKAGLLLTAEIVRFCVGSPRPEVMPARLIVCGPAFSRIAGGLAVAVSAGGWLTGRTVTVNVWVVVFDAAVGGTAVVGHEDSDRGGAAGIGHRGIGERAGGGRGDVADRGVGDQPVLLLVAVTVRVCCRAGAGRDTAEIDGLLTGILESGAGLVIGLSVGATLTAVTVIVRKLRPMLLIDAAVVNLELHDAVQGRRAGADVHVGDRAQRRLVQGRGRDADQVELARGRVVAAGDAVLGLGLNARMSWPATKLLTMRSWH